jgi:hypothetical protein
VLQALRAHPEIINRAFAQAGKLSTSTTQALAPLACGSAAFWPKPKPALPPITSAEDSDDVTAICETNHQNPARGTTDAKQSRFLAAMGFIGRKQMLWVVEGGCRFREIDAVFRNVRFFFLGIPFKSHPLHIGVIWDNVNIELQYHFVGNTAKRLGIHHHTQIQGSHDLTTSTTRSRMELRVQRHRR